MLPTIDADIETILRHRSVGDLTRALESVLAVLICTTPRPTHRPAFNAITTFSLLSRRSRRTPVLRNIQEEIHS